MPGISLGNKQPFYRRRGVYNSGADPEWDNVILFIPGNGPNNSTNITDLSSYSRTTTLHGNEKISTAQSYFGNGALYFDKTSEAWISADRFAAVDLGTLDFTIEFFCYCLEDLTQVMLS